MSKHRTTQQIIREKRAENFVKGLFKGGEKQETTVPPDFSIWQPDIDLNRLATLHEDADGKERKFIMSRVVEFLASRSDSGKPGSEWNVPIPHGELMNFIKESYETVPNSEDAALWKVKFESKNPKYSETNPEGRAEFHESLFDPEKGLKKLTLKGDLVADSDNVLHVTEKFKAAIYDLLTAPEQSQGRIPG